MVTSFQNLKNAALALKTFFHDFFSSKECPIYWLIALLVNLSLFMGASDFLKEPFPSDFLYSFNDNATFTKTTSYTNNSSTGRVILFVVDDLTPKSFFSSLTKGSVPRKAMERTGVWGVATSQENYSGDAFLGMLLTGSDWRVSPLPVGPEYWYIGEETVLNYLKGLCGNVAWKGKIRKGEMESNLTWATIPSDLNEWIYKSTLEVFQGFKKRKYRNSQKLTIVVHFTGVRLAKSLEGENTPLMEETIQETNSVIDSLVQASENQWRDGRTAYVLVSNLKESPFLVWGNGVSQAQPGDRNVPHPIEWKAPLTKRRDLDRRRIAVLLSCLLGVHSPRNSFGTLPLEYLKDNNKLRAECAVNSAFQLAHLFKDIVARKKSAGSAELSSLWAPISEKSVDSLTSNVNNLYRNRDYLGTIATANYLAQKSQQGIEFYVNFKRNLIWLLIIFTNVGWFLCTATWLCPATNPVRPNQNNDEPPQGCLCTGLRHIFSGRFFLSLLYATLLGTLGAVLTFEEVSYRIYFHLACNGIVWWCFFDGIKKLARFYHAAGAQLVDGDAVSKAVSMIYGILPFIDWLFIGDPNALVILLVVTLSFSSLVCLIRSKNTLLSIWLLTSLPLVTTIIQHEQLNADLSPFLSAFAWILAVSFFAYEFNTAPIDLPILAANVATLNSLAWRSRHGRLNEWVYFASFLGVFFVPLVGSTRFSVRLVQVLFSLSVTLFRPSVSAGVQFKILFLMIHAAAWLLFEGYETTEEFVTARVTRNNARNNPPPDGHYLPSRQIQLHDVRRSSFFLLYCFFVVPVNQLENKITTWQKQYHADIKQSVFLRGLNYYLQVFVPILCLTLLFDHINRKSNRNQSKTIALTMFFYSFMTLVYTVSAYGSSPIQVAASVSYFIQPLLICISFLIALPVGYTLTLPSILSLK